MRYGFVLVCLLSCASIAAAQERPTFVVARLSGDAAPPVLDGVIDDDAWRDVQPFDQFTQQDPIEGAPASERTEVRVLLGRDHLYIGLVAFDSDPTRIIAAQSRRDAVLSNVDSVIVALDTFNDSQNAFIFGTNALGIQYDGQVASEGQTSGVQGAGAGSGQQRGGISAFNPNWDGDWVVRAQRTGRGWEAEMAIPLKTLRYATGDNMTWGFNVMRNIRHKNEQVYLSAIPRGFDIYRVSQAARLTGLDLPARRDLKVTPYVLGSLNKDFTRAEPLDRNADVGGDLKWGIRPNLTLDVTVNTDFAQVEADEEQVNLTRFDPFFPEKRAFFLENASTFQFGSPQAIDLFFSRRIGLSSAGQPIDIIGGGRLSGKLGDWNVGVLNVQTDAADDLNGNRIATENNFTVLRAQRVMGRSSVGAIAVNRQGRGRLGEAANWNRAYGVDGNWQVSGNQRVSAFVARTDTPGALGSDYAGRAFYNFTNNLWQVSGGFSQVGENFNPEVGFLPRRGYRRPELRVFFQPQPKGIPWIRRIAPHMSYNSYYGLDGELQSTSAHLHAVEIQPAQGGRVGWFMDYAADRPRTAFVVYNRDGRRVSIPAGNYDWWQQTWEYLHNPSAVVTGSARLRYGNYYDGDFRSVELTGETRIGSRFTATAGWTRQDIELPGGSFVTDLIPVKASYAFTTMANVQALVQYNGQTAQFSSNIRLALLDRSSTGFFIVYNDRRDMTSFTPLETLGRSFVIKYTRLLDF